MEFAVNRLLETNDSCWLKLTSRSLFYFKEVFSKVKYFLLGLGGAIGASLRYIVSVLFLVNQTPAFPFATLTVNLLGCFILGFLSSGFELNLKVDTQYLFTFKTGLIGSFTTFSTFSVEVFSLLENEHFLLAFIYIFLSAILGLFFAFLGIKIGERLVKRERAV